VRLARSHLRFVNEVLTKISCRTHFRVNVYYHATSNTHDTYTDRSRDFEGPPATAGVSCALILPLASQ
jgi:hypothetical protein